MRQERNPAKISYDAGVSGVPSERCLGSLPQSKWLRSYSTSSEKSLFSCYSRITPDPGDARCSLQSFIWCWRVTDRIHHRFRDASLRIRRRCCSITSAARSEAVLTMNCEIDWFVIAAASSIRLLSSSVKRRSIRCFFSADMIRFFIVTGLMPRLHSNIMYGILPYINHMSVIIGFQRKLSAAPSGTTLRSIPKHPCHLSCILFTPSQRRDLHDRSHFRSQSRAAHQARYLQLAAELKPLLADIDGFIDIERFQSLTTDGKIPSLSGGGTKRLSATGSRTFFIRPRRPRAGVDFTYYRIRWHSWCGNTAPKTEGTRMYDVHVIFNDTPGELARFGQLLGSVKDWAGRRWCIRR